MQTDTSSLANNSHDCWMLHVASVCTPCCMLLRVVALSFKPVNLLSQQLPLFLFFLDHRSIAQRCCWQTGNVKTLNTIRSLSFAVKRPNLDLIVRAMHTNYTWFRKSYGLYPSHNALASVCTPLPTQTQQLPTFQGEQCWELLRLFARSLQELLECSSPHDRLRKKKKKKK